MVAITAFLAGAKAFALSKGGAVALGVLIPLVAVFLKRFIPSQVDKYFEQLTRKALSPNTSDPKLAELIERTVLANSMLAEYLIPDAGVGEKKKARVLAALTGVVGGPAAKLLAESIDIVVISSKQELRELAEAAKAKIAEREAK